MKKIQIFLTAIVMTIINGNAYAQTWTGSTISTATTGDCNIGGNNNVTGNSVIGGSSTITGNSIISGTNTVTGNETVGGTFTVISDCNVGGNNNVTGNSIITGNETVGGTFTVISDCNVGGNNNVTGNSIISGSNAVTGNETVGGTATVSGNEYVKGGTIDMTMPADADRTIIANSSLSSLYIQSGTGSAPGASISLRSVGYTGAGGSGSMQLYTTGGDNGAGFTFYNQTASPSIQLVNISPYGVTSFVTKNTTGNSAVFYNYDGTSNHKNVCITNQGQMTVGHDLDPGSIATGDVLTVQNQIGFYAAVDATARQINGNTNAGVLSMSAKTSANDGSSISLYGASHATYPGQLQFTSNGTSGNSALFYNFDGTTNHYNVCITNTGQMTVGHDLAPSSIATGDVLTVQQQMGFYSTATGDPDVRQINGNTNSGNFRISAKTSPIDGSCITLYGAASSRPGNIYYTANGSSSGTSANNLGHLFLDYDPVTGNNARMAITNSGKVIIGEDIIWGPSGSNIPGDYLLYVETGILTEKLKVASSGDSYNWSDFVFNKDYKLMPLNKVEAFVKTNKHLPEIPSAADVAKDGIDVAGMDAKLLQKIEELTLYVIQQQKEIDELKKQQGN